jgi:hypothetical protein
MSTNNSPSALVAPVSMEKEDLKKDLSTLYGFLNQQLASGVQGTFYTTAKLAQMVSNNQLSQSGKLFYNSDTNLPMLSHIVAGNLVISPITLTFSESITKESIGDVQ